MYAVGLRVLRMSPAWLLVSSFGFLLLISLLNWFYQPALRSGPDGALARENNATNRAQTFFEHIALAGAGAAYDARADLASAGRARQTRHGVPGSFEDDPPALLPLMPESQAVPQQAPSDGERFAVQVGAHKKESEANAHVSEMRAAGYTARAEASAPSRRGVWYTVYVGEFRTREDAARLAAELRARRVSGDALVSEIR